MFSPETIRAMSRKAARDSARAGVVPLLVEEEDLEPGVLERHLRGVPFIGDRVPRGYRKVEDWFVDTSGWGSEDEPAMTQRAFLAKVRENGAGYAYALTEVGQFQGYVGVFRYKGARA